MPMTFGIFRPVIVLPESARSWPAERMDAVLRHETAHVRRRDALWHALGKLACAFYWPHPLAWYAMKQALAARERAADDCVLASGARPSEYAASLLEIARSLAAPPLCRSIAIADRSQLEGRMCAILDERVSRRPASRAWVSVTAAVTLLGAFALASFRPAVAQTAETKAVDRATALYWEAVRANPQNLQLYRQALDAARKSGNQAIAARVLHNMGVIEWPTDRGQAELYFNEAIGIESGLGSPLTAAATLKVYAKFLRDAGRTAEADEFVRRARILRDRSVGVHRVGGDRGVYRIGGAVRPPQLQYKVEPAYSEEARAAKVEGAVVLQVVIGTDGLIQRSVVSTPLGFGLDEEAQRAVQKWRFAPGTKDGLPVSVQAMVEVNFRLL